MAAKLSIVTADFYPRPPHGGRLYAEPMETIYHCISTHALRMEGDAGGRRFPPRGMISTHALRMEGDSSTPSNVLMRFAISTHALRMEGNQKAAFSRCPCRDFYPRPPHGGRQEHLEYGCQAKTFLPTPSAWRATERGRAFLGVAQRFLPTPSAWRATSSLPSRALPILFLPTPSAWRATFQACLAVPCQSYFYPRPPHGGRHCLL